MVYRRLPVSVCFRQVCMKILRTRGIVGCQPLQNSVHSKTLGFPRLAVSHSEAGAAMTANRRTSPANGGDERLHYSAQWVGEQGSLNAVVVIIVRNRSHPGEE